jgi:two-component system response regulator MprA
MMTSMLVLVVEDDPAVRASLERSLAFEGYAVVTAPDGEAGLVAVAERRPDVVVLDLGLPRLDGLELCRRLRAAGDTVPILMLTARESTGARVSGLDAGADDYLPKPFALEELYARLRALLRRAGATAESRRVLVVGDLRLDTASREAFRGDRPLTLTRTEYDLLALLMGRPARCSPGRRSSPRSGATTSTPARTPSRSTSATCAARPRRAASRASSTPCGAWATSSAR